ncbi:hypothetical protein KSS87_007230, partial [Heliosperma pusillum]
KAYYGALIQEIDLHQRTSRQYCNIHTWFHGRVDLNLSSMLALKHHPFLHLPHFHQLPRLY